jgi:hypothetical protein
VGALASMNKAEQRATFAPPVFKSRVLRARMLIKASGKKFVWSEDKQKFILEGGGKIMGTRSRKKLTVTPTSSARQDRAQRAAAKVQARKRPPVRIAQHRGR